MPPGRAGQMPSGDSTASSLNADLHHILLLKLTRFIYYLSDSLASGSSSSNYCCGGSLTCQPWCMAGPGNTISASVQVMSAQRFLSRPSHGHLIGPNPIINQLSASALLITATTCNQSVWSLSLICPKCYESQHCTRCVLRTGFSK